ncbi:hypothetical protein QIA37_05155 (plasmid) [Borrelia sp. CA_690]|uniref:hypothetical protein n=1 Tax=Borrelia TaxID=138 RepID=UPI002B1FCE96|nr:hypothetical protein [Borrelia maritima]
MDRKNTKILLLVQLRDGVSKNISAIMFLTLLSKKYKVLLIDADPQASIKSYFPNLLEEQGIDVSKHIPFLC